MSVPAHVLAAIADVARIAGDKRLDSAKRAKRISDRRGQALADHVAASLAVARHVTLGEFTVSVDGVSVHLVSGAVELHGVVVTRFGVDVGLDPHRTFQNPPLLFPDATGDVDLGERGRHRIDPAAVILNEIIEAARRGGP